MPPSTASASSLISSYWLQPTSPAYTLRFSHEFNATTDGAMSPRDAESFHSGDSNAQRKMFVFGTPTRSATTSTSVSEINLAAEEMGMKPVRGSKGKAVWESDVSIHNQEAKRMSMEAESSYRMMREMQGSRGGEGSSGWVMYNDGGRISDARAAESREGSKEHSATTSPRRHQSQTGYDMMSLTGALSAINPPDAPTKSPTESRFKEDLAERQSTESPLGLGWIRQKAGIRRNSTTPEIHKPKAQTRDRFIPKALARLASTRKQKRTLLLPSVPPDDRDLKQLTPRPIIRPSTAQDMPLEAEELSQRLAQTRTQSVMTTASRRLSTAFGFNEKQPNRPPLSLPFAAPPRSKSVPPGLNPYGLSFLPSEARSIVTPDELPIFNAKNLGGQKLDPTKEFGYFENMGMVQSKPPLRKPGEVTVQLDPKAQPNLSPPDNPRLQAYPSVSEIAPFIAQDVQCDRPVGNNKLELSTAFARAKSARETLNSSVDKGTTNSSSPVTNLARRPSRKMSLLDRDSGTPGPTGRNRSSIANWIHKLGKVEPTHPEIITPLEKVSSRTPLPNLPKPAEVVLEIAKRQKRDTGIIGLDPAEPMSSSDDSFSYAAATRDIAGLSKHPTGNRRANSSESNGAKGGF